MRVMWTCRWWDHDGEVFESSSWNGTGGTVPEKWAEQRARIDAFAAIYRGARKVEVVREERPDE
jgi:hypothetical protein